jgi:hypothetical protein
MVLWPIVIQPLLQPCITNPKNPFNYFLTLLYISVSTFYTIQCMDKDVELSPLLKPGAFASAYSLRPPASGIPSLQEICAKKLKDGINWQRRPLKQAAQLYAKSTGIPDYLWGQISFTLIKQGLQPTSCTQLLQDAYSQSADGSVGIVLSRHTKRKQRITIIDMSGIKGFFFEKKPLEDAILSLDGRYVLTLKNKTGHKGGKNSAYIKIWDSQHQACLGQYRFSERLERISRVDGTEHIVLKTDKNQYITTIQALLDKHRGIQPKYLDLAQFCKLQLFRSTSEMAETGPKKFCNLTNGVWNARNPKRLFKSFLALSSSFEDDLDNPFYLHVSPSGLFLACGDAHGVISIWDLEKKGIVSTHQLPEDDPIRRIAWRTHDKITVLTQQHCYQFDIRDLMVGLFLQKIMSERSL